MSAIQQAYAGSFGGSAAPPLPAFTDMVAAYSLWDWQAGNEDTGVNYTNDDSDNFNLTFPANPAPYALPWGNIVPPSPYLIDVWNDQNGNTYPLAGTSSFRPTLDDTNQLISFNGTANGLNASASFTGVETWTIYFDFAPQSLAETGVIFETNRFSDAANTENQISIRMVAGVLTCSVYDATPVTPLPNTKTITLPDTSRIWGCFTIDTTQVTPADQTALTVNNSTSGVSSPASADLAASTVGGSTLNVGARDSGSSSFLTADMWTILVKNVVDDAPTQTAYYDYGQYLKSLAP